MMDPLSLMRSTCHPPPLLPAVSAMQQVAQSLGVPPSLGWQGDPCTPLAWPGVNCSLSPVPQGQGQQLPAASDGNANGPAVSSVVAM